MNPKNGLSEWAVITIVLGPNGTTVMVFDPYKDDPIWNFPGGKRKKELNETVLQTGIRELREETGIEVAETDLVLVEEIDKSRHRSPHTLFVFKVEVNNFDGLLNYGNEGEIVKLVEMEKIHNMKDFFPPHKIHLRRIYQSAYGRG